MGAKELPRRPAQAKDVSLIDAIVKGDKDAVLQAIKGKGKAKLEAKDKKGQTALHVAATISDAAIVELLLQKGAVKDAEDNAKQTPLHLAVRNGKKDIVQMLLKRRVDKHAEDKDENTAFYYAVFEGKEDIAKELGADAETKGDLLLRASKEGNTEAVNLLLAMEANPRVTDRDGKTPLHCAVFNGHQPAAEALNGTINDQDDDDNTILHSAVKYNNRDATAILLDLGADVKAVDTENKTPLYIAVRQGNRSIADLLVCHGADTEDLDENQDTLLHQAVKEGHEEAVAMLLELDAFIEATDGNKKTAFENAITNGEKAIAKILADNNADTEGLDSDSTLLIQAVKNGEDEKVELLIDLGAAVNAEDSKQRTALYYASFKGKVKIAKLLKEQGSDPEATDGNGKTLLMQAAEQGDLNTAKLLRSIGAEVEAQDSDDSTLLHQAAETGKLKAVRVLIELDANKEAQDSKGRTPLHRAVFNGHVGIARFLVTAKADIEALIGKETILHQAARDGDIRATEILVENGAKLETQDKYGRTAFYLAVFEGRKGEAVAEHLARHGANKDATDLNGNTILIHAAKTGEEEAIEILLDLGANKEFKDRKGYTPVHHAVFNGHAKCAHRLIDAGAIKDAVFGDGRTMLTRAIVGGNRKIVELLLALKVNVETIDGNGHSPLYYAVFNHRRDIAELIGQTAKKNIPDSKGDTLLHRAVAEGDRDAVDILTHLNAPLKATNGLKQTPLCIAVFNGHFEIAEDLVERGADPNAIYTNGLTLLASAVVSNNAEAVELLLRLKASIKQAVMKTYLNEPALSWAIRYSYQDIARMLIDHDGVDLEAQDDSGFRPLHAATYGNEAMTRMLLFEKDVEVDPKTNSTKLTPLMRAIDSGKVGIVEMLIDKGADINTQDVNLNTPLHSAAIRYDDNIAKCLLGEKSLNLNPLNTSKETPLFRAVLSQSELLIRLLLEKGANPNTVTSSAESPLFRAVSNNNESVVRLLLDKNAYTEYEYANGETALLRAASNGWQGIVKLLLDKGANVSKAYTGNQWTALHFAAMRNDYGIAQLLLNKNSPKEVLTVEGESPLLWAANGGHESMSRLLVQHGASKYTRHQARDANHKHNGLLAWNFVKNNPSLLAFLSV
ncbi:hypothetical protein VE00_11137 [Pseudogymnoascus sp. WSF 3629]|nr:hypothetical protein VE00_11137 [Pseudogymnoascus sp. WSF 3629]